MLSLATAQILLRPAYADDERALNRLAALDSAAAAPPPPLLVAEVAVASLATVTLSEPLIALEEAVAVATVGALLVEVLVLIAVDKSRFCTLPWKVIICDEMPW